jgi:putative PIN family toxin of toxin-antitoxin system
MDEKKGKLRLVIDTNLVVASYFNPRSASAKILRLLMDNTTVSIVYTEEMRREMRQILRNIRCPQAFLDGINGIFDAGTKVSPSRKHRLVRDDPEDDKFVDCALAAGANYLITNDHHMLKLKDIDDVEVLRPTQFVKRLEGERRERSD